jgi:hypothetical protein
MMATLYGWGFAPFEAVDITFTVILGIPSTPAKNVEYVADSVTVTTFGLVDVHGIFHGGPATVVEQRVVMLGVATV